MRYLRFNIGSIFLITLCLILFSSSVIAAVPTVETRSATSISQTLAVLNGAVTSDGGAAIDERRFDWGTTSSCADGWTSAVSYSGAYFSYALIGLTPGKTYYFRAWAHNSAGWSHGNVLSFTTQSQLCTPNSKRCNGANVETCNSAGSAWTVTQSCGSSSCGSFGSNYCKTNNVYHSRTCNNRGCSSNACYDTPYTDEQLVQTCASGQTCSNGNCVTTCTPKTCSTLGYSCGSWSDGCSGTLNCGTCPTGKTCSNGQCVSTCTNQCTSGAKQCSGTTGYQTCGDYNGDGCTEWSSLTNCPTGQFCSGGVCSSSCTNECSTSGQKQCSGSAGYQTCGNYDADSCLEWSSVTSCASGQVCSGGNCVAGCTPKTCSSLGYNCGTASDGCSGTLNCGTCSTGYTCSSNKCVAACTPKTCSQLGKSCGSWSDGCSSTLNCGTCASGKTCSNGQCVSSVPTLRWPLPGNKSNRVILSGGNFGDAWTWTYCGGLPKKHVGVDIKANANEAVYASYSGTVRAVYSASSTYNWGKGIVVESSGFTVTYLHVKSLVSVGNSVTKGQKIATIADITSSGSSNHLHLGVRTGAYSSLSQRGALPQLHGTSDYENGKTTYCKSDPLFQDNFVDPWALTYTFS